MDLLYFLKVLFKRKWIIIGVTLVAMITTFVLKLFQKPLYESKAQYSTGFTIEKVKLSEGSSIADLYTADTKFDNVIETFKSPRVIGMISYRLLLHDLESPSTAWTRLSQKQKESPEYKSVNVDTVIKVLSQKVLQNELLRSDIPEERKILEFVKLYKYDFYSILEHLFINRVNKTDYLDIVYRSENPYLSAWLVNAMGNEFINYYKNLSFQRTNENVTSIKELERQQQNKVDSLNNMLLQEKIKQGSIDPASLSSSAMETVKDLEGKLADERSRYELNKNRLGFLKQQLSTFKTASGNTNSVNAELLDLIDQKNKLEAQLIAKGGSDQQLQQELYNLRIKINSKSSQTGVNTRNSLKIEDIQSQINEATANMNAAEATMNDFTSRINYYKGLTNINPGSGVKVEVIKSKLDIEQKQLANLKDKLNQAEGLSKDDPTSNFTQTLIGQPAVEPEPKKTITTMGVAGMSMFFLTCFTFLFLEVFNASIKTPYGYEKNIRLPLKGVVNTIKTKQGSLEQIILNEEKADKQVQILFKNNIRKLRYELQNTDKKVFLFTSTASGTGKSFLIEAIAMSFVLTRKKILIIDLNLHNNTLSKRLNAESNIQNLSGLNINLPASTQKIATHTPFENIDIIGCEETTASPSEVLFRLDFGNFLNKLKENYDYIFIETAAMNKYSDTKELMKYVDITVCVFSAQQILTPVDKTNIQFLLSLQGKSFGGVLNNLLPENMNY